MTPLLRCGYFLRVIRPARLCWWTVFVLLACTQAVRRSAVGPEDAARGYWDKLNTAKSFSFDLRYHTDVPFKISASFRGTRQSTDRESWDGEWMRGAEREPVTLRAAGPVQYERDGGVWRRTQRGLETKILDQAGPVLRGVKLRPAGRERGRYVYEFNPEVPIIDPAQTRKLLGRLELDARTGLPLRVYCSDSVKAAEWELKFSGYNHPVKIDVPFLPVQMVEVVPNRRLSRTEWAEAARVVEARLTSMGTECRISRTRAGFRLELDRAFSPGHLGLMVGRGQVEVWSGSPAGDSLVRNTAIVVGIGGDAARRIRLGRRLAGPDDLELQPRLDLPVDPRIAASFPALRGAAFRDSMVVLLVDGAAVSSGVPDSSGDLLFGDIGGEDMVRILAAVAEHGALPAAFTVAGRR